MRRPLLFIACIADLSLVALLVLLYPSFSPFTLLAFGLLILATVLINLQAQPRRN